MCNYMRTLILTLIILIISSCSSDESDLGQSYFYLDSFEAKDVGFPDGPVIYKSTEKYLFQKIVIGREVVQVQHNDNYIFAKQVATDNNGDTNNYIIDKLHDILYGPMTADSLTSLKRTLRTDE
jgi:hypothetical protein